MQTAAVKDRDFVIKSDQDEIDIGHQSILRFAIIEAAPLCDRGFFHGVMRFQCESVLKQSKPL